MSLEQGKGEERLEDRDVAPKGAIFHYTVDGEPQTTTQHVLTPRQILTNAGINPQTYYLVQIKGNVQESYKDIPDKEIHMHQHMKFISIFIGETPVSIG
jgi:hypothetical protein